MNQTNDVKASAAKVSVVDSENKGRIMLAVNDIKLGECLFTEESTVHASWHSHLCLLCDANHPTGTCEAVGKLFPPAFSGNLQQQLDNAVRELSLLEAIGEEDRARLLIKCFVLINAQGPQSPLLAALNTLAAVNMDKAQECVAKIKLSFLLFPLLPAFLQAEDLAKIIATLNTNSHELPGYGGSGVFLLASRMEHSCVPNCTFTPVETQVRIYALQDIKAGTALSLDYMSADIYRPTAERLRRLRESYAFTCSCPGCTSLPDLTRAFKCPRKKKCKQKGWVCPIGEGLLLEDWKCLGCGHAITEEVRTRFEEAEAAVVDIIRPFGKPVTTGMDDGVQDNKQEKDSDDSSDEEDDEDENVYTLEMTQKIISQGLLTEGHYAIFRAHERLGRHLIEQGDGFDAEQVWNKVITALDRVLPLWSDEKVVWYDEMAQIRVMNGDTQGAKQAYGEALMISRIACGSDTPQTQQLQALFDRPPRSINEMQMRYQNVPELIAKLEQEGDMEAVEALRTFQADLAAMTDTMDSLGMEDDVDVEDEDQNM